jgi:hypothetical protein
MAYCGCNFIADCANGAGANAKRIRALLGNWLERWISLAHGLPTESACDPSATAGRSGYDDCSDRARASSSAVVEDSGYTE